MQLNHYLNFKGNTEAAFNFYKSVFGGEFLFVMRYSDVPTQEGQSPLSEADRQKIMHISLPINEHTVLMASDISEQFCAQTNKAFTVGTNHYISINLDASEQDEAKRLFDALAVNGTVEMALSPTFWGALYGALTDQFGIQWMINCQLETA
ncbi:VOC family protein [Acinetobacter cumulans]|uniref:VOC family protein n=1 Tax=Acinetobacter cumulans TaxID=2136182 RepID=A0A498CVF5_9GAMM|nr:MULTISPECIES: VOC family protein [Acinetobacter]RFS35962.1 VOC family protein [Acinetobacter sp. SWAC5]RLL34782.1 VOC family protein [Acinetobacter cumulans]RLL44336.1 VOC family protein [Acinetobacter cumulans]